MLCRRCESVWLERIAEVGDTMIVRCAECGHQQIGPEQVARGSRYRDGERELLVVASGEIDD